MSIDKWLSDNNSTEKRKKIEKTYKALPEEKINDLKKQQIRKIIKGKNGKVLQDVNEEDFLSQIIKFKEWLNQRNYLQGDLDKIEVWIKNLSKEIDSVSENDQIREIRTKNSVLKEQYKELPPQFLDEKTRIALNKKINGSTMTNSDRYYLKKLKGIISQKLKEANYYDVLRRILDLK